MGPSFQERALAEARESTRESKATKLNYAVKEGHAAAAIDFVANSMEMNEKKRVTVDLQTPHTVLQ